MPWPNNKKWPNKTFPKWSQINSIHNERPKEGIPYNFPIDGANETPAKGFRATFGEKSNIVKTTRIKSARSSCAILSPLEC